MKTPTLLTISHVAIADVDARNRLRPVSEAGVESLMASIGELGVLKDAIHVRKRKDGKLVLIAGGHRLEAVKRLGWTEIDVKVWADVTDDWARLMEVDDNIAGAELSPLDTAVFLAQRKEIYERLHPETKRGGDRKSPDFKNQTDTAAVRSFATATAEKFGMSERNVFRLLSAGQQLGAHASQLRHAKAQVTLKDLMEISKIGLATERYAVVHALVDGTARSARDARRAWQVKENGVQPTIKDPVEDGFRALMAAWTRSPMAAKKRFLLEMRSEVWEAQNKGVPLTKWSKATDP